MVPMDMQTAQTLNGLTSRFYALNAASFSATRQSLWPGWTVLAELLAKDGAVCASSRKALRSASDAVSLAVADVACGNGRFLRFLQDTFPGSPISYAGWDGSRALLTEARGAAVSAQVPARFIECDLTGFLLGPSVGDASDSPDGQAPCSGGNQVIGMFGEGELGSFDLAVCFGYFHHVPGEEARHRLLREVLSLVRPGGLAAVSLWRFADHPPLREKAERSTAEALMQWDEWALPDAPAAAAVAPPSLDSGDYLLGWGEVSSAARYCHSFSDGEVDALVAAAAPRARLEARYSADGRTGALNTYLVFRAC